MTPISNILASGSWTNSCDLNLRGDITKKMFNKNAKQYEGIERLSAVISQAWDRLTKKPSIIRSINPSLVKGGRSSRRRRW